MEKQSFFEASRHWSQAKLLSYILNAGAQFQGVDELDVVQQRPGGVRKQIQKLVLQLGDGALARGDLLVQTTELVEAVEGS